MNQITVSTKQIWWGGHNWALLDFRGDKAKGLGTTDKRRSIWNARLNIEKRKQDTREVVENFVCDLKNNNDILVNSQHSLPISRMDPLRAEQEKKMTHFQP